MTFFKVISGNEAVDAGFMFLQWNARHACLMACEPNTAHFAQSYDGKTVYRFGWLNPVPEGAPVLPTVEARIIDAQEYEDLITVLDGGETVPEPPVPEPDPEPRPDPDPDPEEKPMSVQEMREKIQKLTEAVLNESKPFQADRTYQAGDIIAYGARVYIAGQVIVKNETVQPGVNCMETTIANVLNTMQAQKE